MEEDVLGSIEEGKGVLKEREKRICGIVFLAMDCTQ